MQISCGTEARSIGFHIRHSSSQNLESVRRQEISQTQFLIIFTLVYSWNRRKSGREAPRSPPLAYLLEVYPKSGASWEPTQMERATRTKAHRTAALLLITQKQLVPPDKPSSCYSGEGHISWAWQPPPGPWNPCCMFQNLENPPFRILVLQDLRIFHLCPLVLSTDRPGHGLLWTQNIAFCCKNWRMQSVFLPSGPPHLQVEV